MHHRSTLLIRSVVLSMLLLRLHSWNQTHASTGRLSTSLPNLQSLPRGTKTVEEEEEFDEDDDEEAAAEDADADGRRASKIVLREINIRDCFRPQSNDSLFLSADFNQMSVHTTCRAQLHSPSSGCSTETQTFVRV